MIGSTSPLPPPMTGASLRVVIAPGAGRILAVDQSKVSAIADISCSPPLPGAAPWVDGIGDHGGRPVLIVAPFGAGPHTQPVRRAAILVLTDEPAPAVSDDALLIGIRIDGSARLVECVPRSTGERLSSACPAAWLRPCRLADATDAVLVDVAAIRKDWEQPQAGRGSTEGEFRGRAAGTPHNGELPWEA